MPIVLMQRDRNSKYNDVPFVIYHYPERYFNRIRGGEEFLYYRPSKGARREEASSYIGAGVLGNIFPDPKDPTRSYVDIEKPVPFPKTVPYLDPDGRLYESRFGSTSAFQGNSIRPISDFDYHRILAAAGLNGSVFDEAPSVTDVLLGRASLLTAPPRDEFRPLTVVPEGTGYRASGQYPDVQESAALQERARADHQHTLRLFKDMVDKRGGSCLYNNNVDLLAKFGESRYLVEVKSLARPLSTVDRMRYGMGQLFDYSVRYRAEIGKAKPVLAFGSMLRADVAWVAEILQGNDVAFVARDRDGLRPVNEIAKTLPIFH